MKKYLTIILTTLILVATVVFFVKIVPTANSNSQLATSITFKKKTDTEWKKLDAENFVPKTNLLTKMKILAGVEKSNENLFSADQKSKYINYIYTKYGINDTSKFREISVVGELFTVHGHDFSYLNEINYIKQDISNEYNSNGDTVNYFFKEDGTKRIFSIEDIENKKDLLPSMRVNLSGVLLNKQDISPNLLDNQEAGGDKINSVLITSSSQFNSGRPLKKNSRNLKSKNITSILHKANPCYKSSPPSVTILSPNGGETYSPGENIIVSWKTCNIRKEVSIQINIFTQGGSLPISNTVNSQGESTIEIPTSQLLSDNYKAEVTAILSSNPINTVVDYSDNFFSIYDQSGCTNVENVYCGLIILIDRSGGSLILPTPETIHERIFNGDIHDFFYEESYGKVDYQGKVTDWLIVPQGYSWNFFNEFPDFLQQYIISNNIDMNKYDQVVYLVMGDPLSISGATMRPYHFTVGSEEYLVAQSVIFGNNSGFFNQGNPFNLQNDLHGPVDEIFAHEMGHNLGAGHDGKYECQAPLSIGSQLECVYKEYGNAYSVMGSFSYFSNHFSGILKSSLSSPTHFPSQTQWIDAENEVWIHDSTVIDIDPLESPSADILFIDFNNDMQPEYAIDARSAVGFDVPPETQFGNVNLDGVFIYRTFVQNQNDVGELLQRAKLIDVHNTGTPGLYEETDNALSEGREFYDPIFGIKIKSKKLTNGKFRVSIGNTL